MNPFSAHIGYLYKELQLVDRIGAAAEDGFTAIEHPEPYEIPAAEMRRRIEDLGLTFTQISSGMGEKAKGENGLSAISGRETDFRQGFLRALDYAHAVGCQLIHPMAGTPGGGWLDAGETYRSNIGWAIEACAGSGIRVLVEAITLPGYYLGSLKDAIALQDAFGQRLMLLFDTYHAANLLVDPVTWIDRHADRIGHVHIADHPGRHQPGTGKVDFPGVLNALARAGYRGPIGFEYVPTVPTRKTIAFLKKWKRSAEPAAPSQIYSGASS